jgi:NTP pyrophosphatase (non-canonical NTP hydrolase)
MDISTEIRNRLVHEASCKGGGFTFETVEPSNRPGTIRVSADCNGCDATIFDVEFLFAENNETTENRARFIVSQIYAAFPNQPEWRFVTGVAEEAGEVVGAYNRFTGPSRRTGTKDELAKELADTVFTAYMAAEVLGIDLQNALDEKYAILTTRGWKQGR